MWGKLKNAAKKVGNAFKSAGRGILQGLKQGLNLLKEILNRFFGIFDFLGSLLGIMIRKRIRVRIIVLAEPGPPVVHVSPQSHETVQPLLTVSDLEPSIEAMREIFWKECRTRLRPGDTSIITIDDEPAPDYAMSVDCNWNGYKQDFGSRGWYFGWRAKQHAAGFLTGYASPLTVFVVREQVDGGNGCSMGPLTDYVTVVADSVKRDPNLIAHELGHACGLWHWNKQQYVMHRSLPHGAQINRLQRAVFRNSRHVTFL